MRFWLVVVIVVAALWGMFRATDWLDRATSSNYQLSEPSDADVRQARIRAGLPLDPPYSPEFNDPCGDSFPPEPCQQTRAPEAPELLASNSIGS